MKNLKSQILDLEDKEIGKSYGEFLSEVICLPHQQDAGANLYRYYSLAKKYKKEESVIFDKEEKEFILEKLQRVCPPLPYGRLKDFIDECTDN